MPRMSAEALAGGRTALCGRSGRCEGVPTVLWSVARSQGAARRVRCGGRVSGAVCRQVPAARRRTSRPRRRATGRRRRVAPLSARASARGDRALDAEDRAALARRQVHAPVAAAVRDDATRLGEPDLAGHGAEQTIDAIRAAVGGVEVVVQPQTAGVSGAPCGTPRSIRGSRARRGTSPATRVQAWRCSCGVVVGGSAARCASIGLRRVVGLVPWGDARHRRMAPDERPDRGLVVVGGQEVARRCRAAILAAQLE